MKDVVMKSGGMTLDTDVKMLTAFYNMNDN